MGQSAAKITPSNHPEPVRAYHTAYHTLFFFLQVGYGASSLRPWRTYFRLIFRDSVLQTRCTFVPPLRGFVPPLRGTKQQSSMTTVAINKRQQPCRSRTHRSKIRFHTGVEDSSSTCCPLIQLNNLYAGYSQPHRHLSTPVSPTLLRTVSRFALVLYHLLSCACIYAGPSMDRGPVWELPLVVEGCLVPNAHARMSTDNTSHPLSIYGGSPHRSLVVDYFVATSLLCIALRSILRVVTGILQVLW